MLHRVLELREEIVLFLERKKSGKVKEKEFHAQITDNVFISKLAYLADFFGEINTLNLSLQGNMTNILTAQDKGCQCPVFFVNCNFTNAELMSRTFQYSQN